MAQLCPHSKEHGSEMNRVSSLWNVQAHSENKDLVQEPESSKQGICNALFSLAAGFSFTRCN